MTCMLVCVTNVVITHLMQGLCVEVAILCEEEGPFPLGSQSTFLTAHNKQLTVQHNT